MSSSLQNVSFIFEQIGLGVLLVNFYGIFARKGISHNLTQISLGLVFGLAAILAMSNPIELADGVIADMRNVFVGMAAAFFGWRGGAVCAVIAIATRLGLGGAGAMPGAVGISIAMLMGLAWAYHVRPKLNQDFIAYQVLAIMVTANVASGFMIPKEFMAKFFREMAPIMLLGNVIGANIFGHLIKRELSLVGETKRLVNEAATDPLTKILNRRSGIASYNRLMKGQAPPRGVAMSCIDLDNFKSINDTYGHLAGDQALQEVAHRLSTYLRPKDVFCRMSGDEFLFVLVNVTSQEARAISERCRSVVDRVPVTCDDQTFSISISIGTVWSRHPMHFEEFRSQADDMLYAAKHDGRNRAAFNIAPIGAPVASVTSAA